MIRSGDTVVLKFGSSTLVSANGDDVNTAAFTAIAASIDDLHRAGVKVVVVSSGAVALGRRHLVKLANRFDIPSKQVLSAVGQHHLMTLWSAALSHRGGTCGQVLVTKAELSSRTANLNVRDTLQAMFSTGVVPIVNENDSLAVDEIRYGDNDSLAAQVALAVGAVGVVLWTDVPGLFTANPMLDSQAKLVSSITGNQIGHYRSCVSGAGTRLGTGGMITKLDAASLAATGGIWTLIVGAADLNTLASILGESSAGTLVHPMVALQDGRTRWILANAINGRVVCNAGAAERIIDSGASLLAVGVTGIQGEFERGDIVRVVCDGQHIATGIVRYSAHDLHCIAGCRKSAIDGVLGYTTGPVVIHRDDMAIV
ncbi:MAG: glutamate 5-kinase [Armatimonadota bacterium]